MASLTILHPSSANFNLCEQPIVHIIAKIFGADLIKKFHSHAKVSHLDSLVFPNAISKSYYELVSGRVTEVINLKGGESQCIGSFTYTPEDSSEEGWATRTTTIDEQRDQLAELVLKKKALTKEFSFDPKVPWSSGWNCLQNAIYLKTGRKVSPFDLMKLMLDLSPSPHLLQKFIHSKGAFFVCGHLLRSFLLKECSTHHCNPTDKYPGSILLTAQELGSGIRAHSFSELGSFLIRTETGTCLIIEDSNGKQTLIDPVDQELCVHTILQISGLDDGIQLITETPRGGSNYNNCTLVQGLRTGLHVEKLGVHSDPINLEELASLIAK